MTTKLRDTAFATLLLALATPAQAFEDFFSPPGIGSPWFATGPGPGWQSVGGNGMFSFDGTAACRLTGAGASGFAASWSNLSYGLIAIDLDVREAPIKNELKLELSSDVNANNAIRILLPTGEELLPLPGVWVPYGMRIPFDSPTLPAGATVLESQGLSDDAAWQQLINGVATVVFVFDGFYQTVAQETGTWDFRADNVRLQTVPQVSVLCSPANPSYLGTPVELTATYNSPTSVHLEATGGPPGQPAFFWASLGNLPQMPVTIPSPNMVANGLFCVTNIIGRYNAQLSNNLGDPSLNSTGIFDSTGTYQVGVTSGWDTPKTLPFSQQYPSTSFLGMTVYYQLMYRDPDPNTMPSLQFNVSNAVGVYYP